MRRREVIAGLGGIATFWPLAPSAQQRVQIKRIAFIGSVGVRESVFKQELAKLGWVEGRDIHIEALRTNDNRIVRATAPYVVSTGPDLIVAVGTEYAQILKEQTDTIPILFAFVADPIASHLVRSLARPAGNLTGFTNLPESSEAGKWLSLLREFVPGISRVMVLHDAPNAIFASMLQEAAPALRVTIHSALATTIAGAEREIETFAREPGGGMIVIPYALTAGESPTIVALAARHRLPAIYGGDVFIAAGGLITYAADADEITRNVARYTDRILKGAKPADLPVQAPTRLRLVINAKAAKALGLTVPPTMLAIADEVIE
jgi:putative tryptophan/tyrosine transport system substrate-binding protein